MKCALITAGGCGTRLYPLSTEECPKQFVKMFKDKTLIELTYNRVNKFVKKENIFIVLPEKYKHFVKEIFPKMNEENIIIEPEQKSTAPCILYSCFYIKKIRKDATLFVFPADHYIINNIKFVYSLNKAYRFLKKKNSLVLFGIKPTEPLERYGYLKCNDKRKITRISEFKEKPNKETAIEYFNSDNYFWSSDISAFNIGYMLKLYKRHLPNEYDIIKNAVKSNNIEQEYSKCNAVSTAYAIFEKAKNINMIKCNFKWDDVGVFESLLKYTKNENVINAYEKN